MTTVGVVGTGRMGSAMAYALSEAGHAVLVYNRTAERATALAGALGCDVCASAAEVARRADIVLTMLADDEAVRSTWSGADGLIAGAGPGNVLVDLSTVTPDTIRSLEADTRATGAGILDSPVSGSVATAQSGQLTLMVGGTAEDLERARPGLAPLAKTIVHVGPLGSGAAMKLAVNTVIFGLNGAVAEGLALAEAAGVDRAMAYDILAASAVGAPYLAYKRAAFVEPETTPVAFSLDLAAKDLGLIQELAERVGLDLPQASTNLAAIQATAGRLGGDADFSAVAVHVRSRRKGVPPLAGGG